MRVFLYDQSFEGLLTCVFEAYAQHCFPDQLIAEGEVLPMFVDEQMTIVTDRQKAERVWKGLEKHLSPSAMTLLTNVWLSELPEVAN
ncbi:MAG: DNA metabolism protein, partial [Bacteroidaceae bacterium]|nr:DNA metabolism protein [Bacteroidaceae bacterium]